MENKTINTVETDALLKSPIARVFFGVMDRAFDRLLGDGGSYTRSYMHKVYPVDRYGNYDALAQQLPFEDCVKVGKFLEAFGVEYIDTSSAMGQERARKHIYESPILAVKSGSLFSVKKSLMNIFNLTLVEIDDMYEQFSTTYFNGEINPAHGKVFTFNGDLSYTGMYFNPWGYFSVTVTVDDPSLITDEIKKQMRETINHYKPTSRGLFALVVKGIEEYNQNAINISE